MEIGSIYLHLKIKQHGIGYGDVFETGGITGRSIARTLGKP